MGQLDRITQQPEVMGGKACIRGMRVTVGMVVGQIGAGHSVDEVLADYPYLEREDHAGACATPPARARNVKSRSPAHEAAGGHEPVYFHCYRRAEGSTTEALWWVEPLDCTGPC